MRLLFSIYFVFSLFFITKHLRDFFIPRHTNATPPTRRSRCQTLHTINTSNQKTRNRPWTLADDVWEENVIGKNILSALFADKILVIANVFPTPESERTNNDRSFERRHKSVSKIIFNRAVSTVGISKFASGYEPAQTQAMLLVFCVFLPVPFVDVHQPIGTSSNLP